MMIERLTDKVRKGVCDDGVYADDTVVSGKIRQKTNMPK